jgi:hypothetical protein
MVSATYVGTRGERILVNSQNLNEALPGPGAPGPRRPYFPINPNLANVAYRTNAGDSKYHSLQLHAEKRLSRGLTFGGSYTYASYLSDVGNPNGGGNSDIQNHFCIACNWGPTTDARRLAGVVCARTCVRVPAAKMPRITCRRELPDVTSSMFSVCASLFVG